MAPPQVVARYMAQMRGEPDVTIIEGSAADVAPPEPKLIEGEIVDDLASLKTAETGKKRGLFRR
jgi:hypothetical protein